MKAVLLAAGIGSRLRPITNEKPKTLVEVNGKPMLWYLLNNLYINKINDVIICTGYKSKKVINYCEDQFPSINFIFVNNEEYELTNNMYSLYLAKEYLDDDIILMNSDLVYDSSIINGLKMQQESCVAVDKGRYLIESMKIVVENDVIKSISKKINENDAFGSSIDVYKINKNDCNNLINEMKRIIEGENDKNSWTEVMLDNLFREGTLIAIPYEIGDSKWYEIDDFEDLAEAELLFNEKLRSLPNKKIFFIDRDGTLTIGKNKIDGCDEFIRKLKENGKHVFMMSNNSSYTPEMHFNNLLNCNIEIEKEDIVVSTQVALSYFNKKGINRIYCLANEKVLNYIQDQGFFLDDENPQAILLTYDTEINYKKIIKFTRFIQKGLPYYATHHDIVCPTIEGNVPDAGAFINLFFQTTGIRPNRIFGKPNRDIVNYVMNKNKFNYEDAVIIGDRLYTDIQMGIDSQIFSILVLSGETKREDYEFSETRADVVSKNINELIWYLDKRI